MPGCMPLVLGRVGEQALGLGDDGVGLDAALFEHGADDAFLFLGQGDQQVEREHDLAVVLFGDGLGLLESFLGFLSEFVQSKHYGPPMKERGRRCACPQFKKA